MYQKIVPHLWFDTEAKEAAEFYTGIFPESEIVSVCTFPDTPSGGSEQVIFEVMGYRFMGISAGPFNQKNPSISFLIPYTQEETGMIEGIWEQMMDGGKALMDMGEYSFNKKYGWIEDKYNVSWQFFLMEEPMDETYYTHRIVPTLTFTNEVAGKAEEAAHFYIDIFNGGKEGEVYYYPEGMAPDLPTHVIHGDYELESQNFFVQDSSERHDFNFSEGISLLVNCDTQEEIDYYWERLTAVPESEQCGWLKDKYGLSWQISPKVMDEMAENATEEELKRITEAFLKMKKYNLSELERAYKEGV